MCAKSTCARCRSGSKGYIWPAGRCSFRPVRAVDRFDDGDADLDEPDNLYIADLRDGKSYAAVLPFRMMSDFRRAGEIEGLTVDPVTDELLVLSNRGSRIVLGMVRGFYPGYDSELHEVYVYEKVK